MFNSKKRLRENKKEFDQQFLRITLKCCYLKYYNIKYLSRFEHLFQISIPLSQNVIIYDRIACSEAYELVQLRDIV